MEKLSYDHVKDVKCHSCDEQLLLIEYNNFYDPIILEKSGSEIWPITTEGEICFVCPTCESLYLSCPECSVSTWKDDRDDYGLIDSSIQLCKFLGFEGLFYSNSDESGYPSQLFQPNLRQRSQEELVNVLFNDSIVSTPDSDDECTNVKWLSDAQLCYDEEIYPNNKFIPYYVGWMNIPYCPKKLPMRFEPLGPIENAYITLTGPDGGLFHFWRCLRCNRNFVFTDK